MTERRIFCFNFFGGSGEYLPSDKITKPEFYSSFDERDIYEKTIFFVILLDYVIKYIKIKRCIQNSQINSIIFYCKNETT